VDQPDGAANRKVQRRKVPITILWHHRKIGVSSREAAGIPTSEAEAYLIITAGPQPRRLIETSANH
jgi:hypothetical protein